MADTASHTGRTGVARIAAFDFDGTLISCQSGLRLAVYLARRGVVSPQRAAALVWWGVRYKLRLPYREEEARELVLGAVSDSPASVVDRLMVSFHDEELIPRYRRAGVAEVRRREREGCACVLVSATFHGIARRAASFLGMDGFLATEVELGADGRYTGRVVGDVMQGESKRAAVASWADRRFGRGGWELAYAYGDHYTDAPLLAAAARPFAVCPGSTLRTAARRQGWAMLDWSKAGDMGPQPLRAPSELLEELDVPGGDAAAADVGAAGRRHG